MLGFGLGLTDARSSATRGPFANTAAILGAGGSDYAFYDSTVVDRLWRAGTGPSQSAIGTQVGLVVDRAKQGDRTYDQLMASQPELIVNGTFNSDLAGWTPASDPSASVSWADGRAQLTSVTGNSGRIRQGFPTIPGRLYQVLYDAEADTILVGLASSNSNGNGILGDSGVPTVAGFNRRFFLAIGTTTWINVRRTTTIGTSWVDNISDKEVPAHWALQGTSAARSTLQEGGLKFDGVDDNLLTDWLAQAGPKCILIECEVPSVIGNSQQMVGMADGTDANGLWLGISSAGSLVVRAGSGSYAGPNILGASAFIAVTVDTTMVRGYLDAAEVITEPLTGTITTTTPARIGCRNRNGTAIGYFGGVVKRVAFGHVAPTPSQIQQIRAEWSAT